MAKWRRVLDKLLSGSKDIRFEEFVMLLEQFGFALDRMRGSHHIFAHPGVVEILSIQPRKDGKAKPCQLRQFLKLVEEYALKPEENGE